MRIAILFSSPDCHGCKAEKAALDKIGLDNYIVMDVQNGGARLANDLGVKSLPTLFVGRMIVGYPGSPEKLKEKIGP